MSNYENCIIRKRFGVADKRAVTIPNGVDIAELSSYKWTPSASSLKVVYSGRLERHQKNIDKLVRSIEILKNTYHLDAQLLIVGRGPYEAEMKRLITEPKLEHDVVWKHWLPRREYLSELSSSNVLVLPSAIECYGIVVAEAVSMGVPCVVTNSTALSDFAESGSALGIEPPVTPEKIASAIRRALLAAPDEIPKMNRMILSWDVVVSQLIDRAYNAS